MNFSLISFFEVPSVISQIGVKVWYNTEKEPIPTRHVHHATVAVVHQVARFAVDATSRDAVSVKEVWLHGRHLAVSPGRGEIYQL